jgi:hypothetical protein
MNNTMIIVTAITCSSTITSNGISGDRLGDPFVIR